MFPFLDEDATLELLMADLSSGQHRAQQHQLLLQQQQQHQIQAQHLSHLAVDNVWELCGPSAAQLGSCGPSALTSPFPLNQPTPANMLFGQAPAAFRVRDNSTCSSDSSALSSGASIGDLDTSSTVPNMANYLPVHSLDALLLDRGAAPRSNATFPGSCESSYDNLHMLLKPFAARPQNLERKASTASAMPDLLHQQYQRSSPTMPAPAPPAPYSPMQDLVLPSSATGAMPPNMALSLHPSEGTLNGYPMPRKVKVEQAAAAPGSTAAAAEHAHILSCASKPSTPTKAASARPRPRAAKASRSAAGGECEDGKLQILATRFGKRKGRTPKALSSLGPLAKLAKGAVEGSVRLDTEALTELVQVVETKLADEEVKEKIRYRERNRIQQRRFRMRQKSTIAQLREDSNHQAQIIAQLQQELLACKRDNQMLAMQLQMGQTFA